MPGHVTGLRLSVAQGAGREQVSQAKVPARCATLAGVSSRRVPRHVLRALADPDRTRVATAVWTLRALRAARRQLRTTAPPEVKLPDPTGCGPVEVRRSRAGSVRGLLRVLRATCLEECVVRQQWLRSAGEARAIIVGVRGAGDAFGAHAWLEGDRTPPEVLEITRYAAS